MIDMNIREQTTRRPKRFTESELAKVGVDITDPCRIRLRCVDCGTGFSPNIQPGGKMPRGYWKCPHCYAR